MTTPLLNDRLLKALRCQPVDRPPVWIMRQAGRYLPEYRELRRKIPNFMTLCRSPRLCTEVAMQPLNRYNFDAAIVFSDILTIPDAMGLGLHFISGDGPRFERPIHTASQIEKLTPLDANTHLNYVMEAVSSLKTALNNTIPLIGFAGSPWTLATYMVEGGSSRHFQKIKALRHTEPALLKKLLDILAESVANLLIGQVENGADALMIFDTWGGLLAYEDFLPYSLQPMQQAIEKIKQRFPDVPITLFTRHCTPWLDQIAASGCQGIGLDWTVDLSAARQRVPDNIALQGNLDPTTLYGTPEYIHQRVRATLDAYGDQPGHIFNLGHGILPDIHPNAVTALVDAVRS